MKKTFSLLLLLLAVAGVRAQNPEGVLKFTISGLLHSASYRNSSDFLQNETMRARIFEIARSDEKDFTQGDAGVYYVLDGEGHLIINGKTLPLERGSIVYFGKDVPQKINDVTRKLVVLGLYSKQTTAIPFVTGILHLIRSSKKE